MIITLKERFFVMYKNSGLFSLKQRLLVLLALFLFFSTLLTAQTVKLKIIETSDVHGVVFPFDFKNDVKLSHSLANVYTYVKQERAKEDQHVILLDNGDIIQGQPAVYYYNFEQTEAPHIISSMFNYMKYDAATIGNHDIEAGHPVYDRIRAEFNFPWLAANAINKKTNQPYFDAYTIIEKEGVKIAVLGLITPAIPKWLPPKIWEGMYFEDMVETAKDWITAIRNKDNPDLIVGLFHAGVDYTYGNQEKETFRNENASLLVAEQVPGFDIVFVGHDHKIWNKTVKNSEGKDVLILGPSSDARTVATAEVIFSYNKTSSEWEKEIKGEIINSNLYKPDEEFLTYFSKEFDVIKEYVSRPIGNITKTIYSKDAILGNSAFVDLVHIVQLELTNADVSITAPLSMNARINEGDLYVRDMFNLYRYENLLYVMELTGKEIKDHLEYSYSFWFNTMKDENDHLLNFRKDSAGNYIYSERTSNYELAAQYYNFDCAAGINYTVDITKPAGERVAISSFSNGKNFEPEAIYKVALNSYRGNGGGGHLTLGAGIEEADLHSRIAYSSEKDLRYYIMKWIEEKKTVNPVVIGNWDIVPKEWYEKGKERDSKILFGSKK